MSLFSSYQLGSLNLQNRIVMAPMTRCRAIGNIPNALVAEYYGQRSGAGLIVTEGTAPSPNGLGYARIPGLYTDEQQEAWKPVVAAAHKGGAKIFMQFMHTGRICHPLNMPEGAECVSASAIQAAGEMWTDQEMMQPHPVPRALATDEIPGVIREHAQAARRAIAAGFDGVELHGANGYLTEQFLQPKTNQRTDQYGGSWENRNRFCIELVAAIADAIGAERVGVRLSPANNAFNDMGDNPDMAEQFTALAGALGKPGLAYIHIVFYEYLPEDLLRAMKKAFGGPFILNGGMDREKAETVIESGLGELASFGSSYLANPDLPVRLEKGIPLNEANPDTFYTGDPTGYTDYPAAS